MFSTSSLIKISFLFLYLTSAVALSESIKSDFDERAMLFFERNSTNPYPAISEKTDYQSTAWHYLNFAISSLFIGVNEQKANQSLIKVARMGTQGKIKEGEERFHWIAPLLGRAYLLFNENDSRGRLTFSNFTLEYEGLGGDFAFYYSGIELPEVNGRPIDVYPDSSYESPYLNGTWGQADVKIVGLDEQKTNCRKEGL